MNLRVSALMGLIGLAACSNNNEPPKDPTWETGATAPNTGMTPASLESQEAHDGTRDTNSAALAPPAANTAPVTPAPAHDAATDTRSADHAASDKDARDKDARDGRPAAPDNTKVNERDRNSAALTPMDQGNGESDLKITQQIRQAIMGDDSLSFTAKNVKIITQGGKVTLRGPVATAQERSAIEAAARKVAGANVDNQIEVKK